MLPANLYLFAEMDVMMHRNTWYVESKHILIVKQRFFNHKLRLSTSSYLTVKLCFKNGCWISKIINLELTIYTKAVRKLKIILCVAKQLTQKDSIPFDPVQL